MSAAASPSVAVVTGGGSGIGRALCRRFHADGARVAVLDLDGGAAGATAAPLAGAIALTVDVTDAGAVHAAVGRVEADLGPVELYCSNVGVAVGGGLGDDEAWARSWAVHAMAHLYAARAVLPAMAARGSGDFVVTASAAGLLMMMQSAPYTVTKHASVAMAEWLAVEYGGAGVRVHCLAPQGVRTPMVTDGDDASRRELDAAGGLLEPEQVADAVAAALRSGEFLVTPHPEVRRYEAAKVADRTAWLDAMRRVKARVSPAP